MIRVNAFSLFKNKQNKFRQQYLYFLRNSRMRTIQIIGSHKIFLNFWGQKAISLNLTKMFKYLFLKNFTFEKKMTHLFVFTVLNLVTKCFQPKFFCNLYLLFSYLLLFLLKLRVNFFGKPLAELSPVYQSVLKFRLIGKRQPRRLLLLSKTING